MKMVSLAGHMEKFYLKGEFIKTKVEGRKVKLKLALSDPGDDTFNTTFVMKFNLDKINSFNKFASLVEEFFYEQPDEFNVEDFLARKCDVCLAEVYYSARTKRKIEHIKSLKSDYKGITQDKKTTALSEGLEEKKREISALVSRLGHPQA